jgi:D-inositol-3-phosphate glycosyltransferase
MGFDNLRIAMISAHSCPVGNLGTRDTGGMSVYIRELAQELGRQGHTVDIYTRIHDPADPIVMDLGPGARLIHLKAGQIDEMHKLALYCYLPEFTCNLEYYRKDNDLQYDIVFSHYWLSTWVGTYLKQWWQVPHAAMFHTLGAIKNNIGIGEEEPELRVFTEKESIHSCQRIIASTMKEKEEIVRFYGALPERIGVVPCGVNMDRFHPVDKQLARERIGLNDNRILLFVGRIDPLKGIEQLIGSMRYLDNISGLKLLVIGGDEDNRQEITRLKKITGETGVENKIEFRGTIKHEELPLYYSAADICVVPSYYESFGLVALESLACGTPVVATGVGDLKNIIRQAETGYIVEDNSPVKLAQGINQAFAMPAVINSKTLSIRDSVSGFSWTNISKMIASELKKALLRQPVKMH